MHLNVHDTLTGRQAEVPIEADVVTIGRAGAGDNAPTVPLHGPIISRQQALLRRDGESWIVEHLGRHPTKLGDLELERGKPCKIRPGDQLRIAHFVLSFEEERAAEAGPDLDAFDRELIALEHRIHEQLLDKMDLRKGESARELSSRETRARVEAHLDELIRSALANASREFAGYVLRTSARRRLNWRIAAAGSRRGTADKRETEYGDRVFEQMAADVLGRIAADLGVSFDPKRMQEDSEAVDRGFDAAFDDHALELSEGLRNYLVPSAIKSDLMDVIFGFGPLQDLIEMDSISEIMVVSRSQVYVEKFGVIENSRRAFFSDQLLKAIIDKIVAPIGRRIDVSSPLVDAHLPDGSRVNAVIPPLAVKGPCLTIRKFSKVPLTIEDLVGFGALSDPIVKFLRACVRSNKNIIVSGGTGSGKTTLLNCLTSFIPGGERLITIEDTAELQLQQSHVVTLEARPPNLEGKGAVTIRDLVKNALRMRPDRIIVGECRGGEALDMLQAMNTGHDGSMTTGHANTPEDMMRRLETMVLTDSAMPVSAIREQIASAVDIVVQLNRFPDGARCVTQVSEVVGIDPDTGKIVVEDIFVYRPPGGGRFAGGTHVHTGYIPSFIEEMLVKGVVSLDTFF